MKIGRISANAMHHKLRWGDRERAYYTLTCKCHATLIEANDNFAQCMDTTNSEVKYLWQYDAPKLQLLDYDIADL